MLVRLASGSPRRLELLRQIGLEVDVYTSAFDEVSGDNAERVVSYSYTDVLTRDVQLVICK